MDASVRDLLEVAAEQEQIREELGVLLFEPAPEDFDPLEATADELLAHGYPAQPDPERRGELFDHWKQRMSRPMSIIEPQFSVMPEGVQTAADLASLSANWSGGVVVVRDGDAVMRVNGSWTVPHVFQPQQPGIYECATWIGIDGGRPILSDEQVRVARRPELGDVEAPPPLGNIPPIDPDGGVEAPPPLGNFPPNPVSTNILQAGTTQRIVATWPSLGVTQSTWVWWEWTPANPVAISNFPVSPGDVMFCEIHALSATEAKFFLMNQTSGVTTSFVKPVPSNGTPLVGDCAEWILEVRKNVGDTPELADYGTVYFDNCDALSREFADLNPGTAELVMMTNDEGDLISIPEVPANELMRVIRDFPIQ